MSAAIEREESDQKKNERRGRFLVIESEAGEAGEAGEAARTRRGLGQPWLGI